MKTAGNYMRELGIKTQYMKSYRVITIHSDFNEELINILNEEFNTDEGFVYLTSIMDIYSRKTISWVLGSTLEAKWFI